VGSSAWAVPSSTLPTRERADACCAPTERARR
jgi:hypothetical protein